MKKIHVYTSAALNYVPKVRLLFDSIKKFHPEWETHLLLADRIDESTSLVIDDEPFDNLTTLDELDIENKVPWAFCHSIVELCTAVKPFMLCRLLERDDCEAVLYFDPDTVLFSKVDEIVEAIRNSNIALTPHQTAPESDIQGVMDNEISSLKHGAYNFGFYAVNSSDIGKQFAAWWADRIFHFCRDDIKNGLFTDQKWGDLVPAFFDGTCIIRSSRFNVAPWNVSNRIIGKTKDGQYTVNDVPLGFYHFTGFDNGSHAVMAEKYATKNKHVGELIDWYLSETEQLAKDPLSKSKWYFGYLSDGSVISKEMRVVYRERKDLQSVFPNPFDAATYLVWWKNQAIHEYPQLFDENEKNSALSKLTEHLSVGFTAGVVELEKVKFWKSVKFALSSKKNAATAIKGTYRALKTVGLKEFIRKFE